ncbi:MAG: hypothetical protein IJH39_06480 [Clostridia bacterium]|nr:hypothetical protein [Clostridia bacterium]
MIINDSEKFENSIETERKILDYNLKSQENLKNIILNYMKNFSDSSSNINLSSADQITIFIENLKNSLSLCNNNIIQFENFQNNLNNIDSLFKNNDKDLDNKINDFNEKYNISNQLVLENTIKIEDCLNDISKKSELKFSTGTMQIQNDTSKITFPEENSVVNNLKISENTDNNTSSQIFSEFNYNTNTYKENTLVVSETSQNVTLPYNLSDLNEILKNEPKKYSSIDEVITKKYTLPLKNFKNPSVSRFKQGFKLMREKEHSSFKQAFDLGMELVFDSNLHPAIIPACKNLEDLDKYLYCLEKKQTDKFDCFNIVFECPPSAK